MNPSSTPIAVDAMGGDYAPRAVVEGALHAAADGIPVMLVGDRRQIEPALERCVASGLSADGVQIEHASQVVAMEERALAVRRKPDASIRVCARRVHEGVASALYSAGNTGAAMVSAITEIGTIPGVDRPALAAVFPNATGHTVVLDVGANLTARAEHLREFAVMGHFYAQELLRVTSPRIGLLSVGEEEGKGTDLVRRVFKVLERTGLNFVGNVEGGDVFRGTVDVVVCDGFVGNVVLKTSEGLAGFLSSVVRRELSRTTRGRFGLAVAQPALDSLRRRMDWTETGAAPLLGVAAGCLIGHGRSGARAVANGLREAYDFTLADVPAKIRQRVADLHAREAEVLSTARSPSGDAHDVIQETLP